MVVTRSIGSDTILNCYIVSNSSLQTGLSATQFTSKLIVQISNSAKKRRSKYSKHMYNPATLLMKLSHRSKFKREIITELQRHFFCFLLDFCFKKRISNKARETTKTTLPEMESQYTAGKKSKSLEPYEVFYRQSANQL